VLDIAGKTMTLVDSGNARDNGLTLIFMKLGEKICPNDIFDEFENSADAAPKSSIGYGFCVFALEALTVVEKNIQDTFSENGNHPLVKLVANEKLKSAFKKNKRLVSSYTESVLVKEACSVIMHEATGCSYKEATEALQRTVAKSFFTAYSLATTHRSSIKEYWSSALADRRKAW
ncbi:hypothetical protein DPMN_150557, partial [Dreissena polymorpha]